MKTPKQTLAEVTVKLREIERDAHKVSPRLKRLIAECRTDTEWLAQQGNTKPIFTK